MEPLQFGVEWPKQFGFLEQFGMRNQFLLILASARSARDLRHLHSLLPANCQLPQKDFEKLCEFWQGLWGDKKPIIGCRLGDSVMQAILNYMCPEAGLRAYYRSLLMKRVEQKICGIHDADKVYSPQYDTRGQSLFIVCLDASDDASDELKIGLNLFRSHDMEFFGIRLHVCNRDLTEKVTHQLLQLPPSGMTYWMGKGIYCSDPETITDFWYFVPLLKLEHAITNCKNEDTWTGPKMVAISVLTQTLLTVLKEDVGLKVRSLQPCW
ncbi:MAG: hypothetical protein V1668_01440 [Patescibacteria group bacterium]